MSFFRNIFHSHVMIRTKTTNSSSKRHPAPSPHTREFKTQTPNAQRAQQEDWGENVAFSNKLSRRLCRLWIPPSLWLPRGSALRLLLRASKGENDLP